MCEPVTTTATALAASEAGVAVFGGSMTAATIGTPVVANTFMGSLGSMFSGLGLGKIGLMEGLSLVSTGFSAAKSIQAGNLAARNAERERQQYELNAAVAGLRAEQQLEASGRRLKAINSSLLNMAGRSRVDINYGSHLNMIDDNIRDYEYDKTQIMTNRDTRRMSLSLAASQSTDEGEAALLGGYTNAASTVANGAMNYLRYKKGVS